MRRKGRHGVFAGKTVWSMPERFEIYIVYKRRYINTLRFFSFYYLDHRRWKPWAWTGLDSVTHWHALLVCRTLTLLTVHRNVTLCWRASLLASGIKKRWSQCVIFQSWVLSSFIALTLSVGWQESCLAFTTSTTHLLHKKVYEENRAETQITGKLSLKWKLSRWCDIHQSINQNEFI